MPRKSATYLKSAIANYEGWLQGDPDNQQYQRRLEELKVELEIVRKYNRERAAKNYKPRLNEKRVAWLRSRLDTLNGTREYYTIHHASNPKHFDYQFELLNAKQARWSAELAALLDRQRHAAGEDTSVQPLTVGEVWQAAEESELDEGWRAI